MQPLLISVVAIVLAGARTADELDANIAMMRLPTTGHFWKALRARRLIAVAAPLPASGAS